MNSTADDIRNKKELEIFVPTECSNFETSNGFCEKEIRV